MPIKAFLLNRLAWFLERIVELMETLDRAGENLEDNVNASINFVRDILIANGLVEGQINDRAESLAKRKAEENRRAQEDAALKDFGLDLFKDLTAFMWADGFDFDALPPLPAPGPGGRLDIPIVGGF